MNHDAREPCKTCPYRKDVPRGIWTKDEYRNLLAQDRNEFRGATFLCHQGRKLPAEEQGFCVGWLLDQRTRGISSIQLRIHLMMNKDRDAANRQLKDIRPPSGVKLYPSIAAMCRANGVRP